MMNSEQFSNHVSPNQLAFQGLDTPASRFVRAGYSFKISRERDTQRSHVHERSMPTDTYVLEAHHESNPHYAVADLSWTGPEHSEGISIGADYPGHIEYVSTMDSHQRQGLATMLYKHATHTDMGQLTRPVHSPVLTDQGHGFRQAVGGPGATGPGGRQSDAPEGYHPFENEKIVPLHERMIQRLFTDRRLSQAGHKMFEGMDHL